MGVLVMLAHRQHRVHTCLGQAGEVDPQGGPGPNVGHMAQGQVQGGSVTSFGTPDTATEMSNKSLFVAFPAQTKSINSGNMRTADL